jgi:F-type H+-transporting ATPase subunit b
MEIVSKIAMVSINETLIIELISFLIFLFLINRIMFRPLNTVMQERDEHISGLGEDIQTAKQRIEDLNAQLDEQEKAAIDEATSRRIDLETEGAKQAESILAESKKEINGIKHEAQEFVDRQIAEARKTLKTEAERVATEMMEKILERRLVRE